MKIHGSFNNNNQITLYHGNCEDLLKQLPDESVDLIITSPPYCIGKAYEPDFYITPESKPSEPLLQPIFFSYLSKRLCYAILSP